MKENMKIQAFKIMLIILFMPFSLVVNAQNYKSNYSIESNGVYYNGGLIDEADASTFIILGHGYAKDRNNVYMEGRILKYVDPFSFRLVERYDDYNGSDRQYNGHRGGGYFKSNFDVFYDGRKIEDASASTFRELEDGYAKDAFNVYYRGRKVDDASANSFKKVGGGYFKDAFNFYFRGRKVDDASANTFEYTGNGYAHDSFNTYYQGKKVSD